MTELIPQRLAKLNQLFSGRSSSLDHSSLATQDGLLDALFVLYEECENENLSKKKHIAEFVKKYRGTIAELRRLRLSISDFEVKEIIGRGHFGEVQLVREKLTNRVYALKVLRKTDTLSQQSIEVDWAYNISDMNILATPIAFYEEEKDIMAKANSPWLTQLQYAFQDQNNLYLVMEFHAGGDLLSLLSRFDDVFEVDMARFYTAEMVMAIHTLHTMGYIHRDVKPENILIDRTGHVKLADFGSAAKLSDSNTAFSKLPVGTPDYICPEMLLKMNSKDPTADRIGMGCDWWSLAICSYEMLFGKTPFTDENGSMIVTYANIMNFKKCLKFPSDTKVCAEAIDLIKSLLTDVNQRLSYKEICAHPFFMEVDFNSIRQTKPPFIPTVMSQDDTSNFEEFEKQKNPPSLNDWKKDKEFSGKDLPFIGFTFTKNLSKMQDSRPSLASEVASPVCKANMERRLTMKSQELSEYKEKNQVLSSQETGLKNEIDHLKIHLRQMQDKLRKVEAERDVLDRDMAQYITENTSLKRSLETEKSEHGKTEEKAMSLLEEIREQAALSQKLWEVDSKDQIAEQKKLVSQLEQERAVLLKKLEKFDKDSKKRRSDNESSQVRIVELQEKINKIKEKHNRYIEEMTESMEEQKKKFAKRESELQSRLDQALDQNMTATRLMQELRQSKCSAETELKDLKRRLEMNHGLMDKLNASEEKRKSLENQMNRLVLLECREQHLEDQLSEKIKNINQLNKKITILEEQLESSETSLARLEKLFRQKEEKSTFRLKELEGELEMTRSEKWDLEESSLVVLEESEERMRKIQQQEETIKDLKRIVNQLERQVADSRSDAEHSSQHKFSTPIHPVRAKSRLQSEAQACQTSFASDSLTQITEEQSSTDAASIQSTVSETESQTQACQTSYLDQSAACQTSFAYLDSEHSTSSENSSVEEKPLCFNKRKQESLSKLHSSSSWSPSGVQTSSSRGDQSCQTSVWGDDQSCQTSVSSDDQSCQTSLSIDDQGVQTTSRYEEENRGCQTSFVYHSDVDKSVNTSFMEYRSCLSSLREDSSLNMGSSQTPQKVERRNRSIQVYQSAIVDNKDVDDVIIDKESRRKFEEIISDLRQEKGYLETKVGNLEKELVGSRESVHYQRIRALDLKHELREKQNQHEIENVSLKEKVHTLEMSLTEARSMVDTLTATNNKLKEKISPLQQQLNKLNTETADKITRLQQEKKEAEQLCESFKKKCFTLENVEAELKRVAQRNMELESKTSHLHDKSCIESSIAPALPIITTAHHGIAQAPTYTAQAPLSIAAAQQQIDHDEITDIRLQGLDDRLKTALDEKNRFRMSAERAQDELTEKRRLCENQEQKIQNMKVVCDEMEAQIQDLEALVQHYEKKENDWRQTRTDYEKTHDEAEERLLFAQRECSSEKQNRQRTEQRLMDIDQMLQRTKDSWQAEAGRLKLQVQEYKDTMRELNHQLSETEKKVAVLEVNHKSVQRKLQDAEEENLRLKEEISKLITRANELKATNFRLSQNLEEAMDKYDMLENDKTDLENQIETLQANYEHERYKSEATLSQQAKLISYLQEQVENPTKRKKKLFSSKNRDRDINLAGLSGNSVHLRELQNTLDYEKSKVATLKQENSKLKDELEQAKTGTIKLKHHHLDTGEGCTQSALSALVMSPASQPSSFSLLTPARGVTHKPPRTPLPKKERMHHNIPHRFLTGLNSRASKCAVCLGTVHFVKLAAKCQECQAICHPKCAPSLSATCGLPTQYAQHFADVMHQAKLASPAAKPVSTSNLSLQLQNWMKIPRPGKQLWEKKWTVLDGTVVKVYDTPSTNTQPLEEFDLCPSNAEVVIHSAVTAADMTNTATTDLPYILRLDCQPHTTCWPGRSIYLMALNFTEKQKWVATLEALVDHSGCRPSLKDSKLLGNTILKLQGDTQLDMNCTLPLFEKMLLVGAEDGLYVADLSVTARQKTFVKIEGINNVYQMTALESLNTLLIIAGSERNLMYFELTNLRHGVQQARRTGVQSSACVTPHVISSIRSCTTFCWGQKSGEVMVLAAMTEKLCVLQYSQAHQTFEIQKELLLSQPCSCMHFGKINVIIGTDRFYKLDLEYFTLTELLDKKDTSLAFAAFGAAHYDSFPVAVLRVSADKDAEEYLLCYHEFGVFVDIMGQRTRQHDMKWNGLPLTFSYAAPYVYIIHFNSIQVIEIPSAKKLTQKKNKTFVNLVNPRYLGPAVTPGAIYVASVQEGGVDIMCFKGNLSHAEQNEDYTSSEESSSSDAAVHGHLSTSYGTRGVNHAYSSSAESLNTVNVKSTPSKRKVHHGNGDSTSPPKIRTLNHSPRNKKTEKESQDEKENGSVAYRVRHRYNYGDPDSSF